MRRISRTTKGEPTIALINIVFLMLVFFMVAGTLAQPLDNALNLVQTKDLDGRAPPDTLVVHADGRLSYRGEDIASPEAFMELQSKGALTEQAGPVARIVPDRELSANDLVALAAKLRAAGATRVVVITERGLK
ncbi:hypothetical protein P775_13630 [Puniceibacterium antarcticum]|uniref:Biopolymer transporter ExbD n=1 Tax=Puniceibacterium antarcticum TaxID=1206336 RepID=A0A2G8RDC7_9RHOB|nr:biopolymer transporter ExbD [Puniceibacterium antarcticum]PIL19559.1 hypothetical protein P775_13630 [Puniceibacterium antarcticum]